MKSGDFLRLNEPVLHPLAEMRAGCGFGSDHFRVWNWPSLFDLLNQLGLDAVHVVVEQHLAQFKVGKQGAACDPVL